MSLVHGTSITDQATAGNVGTEQRLRYSTRRASRSAPRRTARWRWSEEEVVVKADGTYEIKDSTVQGLLDEASKILEGNPKLEFASYGVGPKPIRATVNRYSAN